MAQQKPIPPTSEPAPSAFKPNDWEDADFIRALASLERLQQQLDQLRKVPSNLVTPFRTAHTPQQVFSSFNAARQDSFGQIAQLRAAWEETRTVQLLHQCSRTQEKHVDLVEQHDIGIWGWREREEQQQYQHHQHQQPEPDEQKQSGLGKDEGAAGEGASRGAANSIKVTSGVRNSEEDEKTASALFGPEFKQFEWDEENATVTVTVGRPGPWLRFEVQRRRTADGVAYEARCVDNTKEAEAISRCLHKRHGQQDIFETMETLLAYGDAALSRADCSRCGKYRDDTGATPSARTRKPKIKTEGSGADESAAWTALHEACLSSQL